MAEKINMGLHPLLVDTIAKRKFRWIFTIAPFIGKEASMLPPVKGARPNLSFKEFSAEHLNETIYFPGKADWSTLEVSLYDVKPDDNVIYRWMNKIYDPDPKVGFYGPSLGDQGQSNYKIDAVLTLYNGCGCAVEEWTYKNAFPLKIDWGDLDMTSSEVCMVDLSLRYDRAYYRKP
jgi:hypothetical protein